MNQTAMRLLLWLLLIWVRRASSQGDVECLREIKSSVSTSGEYLQSWDFNSSSSSGGNPPNICNFIGVQCLHPSELKVYSLSLPGAGLRGGFPKGLQKCSSLTGLDLSSNFLTGPIPAELCRMLPYLVKLDLSQNNISGGIPVELSDCVYLNEIRLQRNRLEGGIPGQIGLLPRLRDFNVADNRLSGSIPYTFRSFSEASFANNEALCGAPLGARCKQGGYRTGPDVHRAARNRTAVIVGVAAGGGLALLAVCAVCSWLLCGQLRKNSTQLDEELLDSNWLRKINAPSGVVVSMFEQPIVKIRLSDLAAATSGFTREAVIGICRTGVFYKAVLRDGSVLSVKKLRKSAMHVSGEKQFRTEMEALAKVRHRNLVPLLGYCIAGSERLLVYKHMVNGSLYSRLHGQHAVEDSNSSTDNTAAAGALDWSARLRIAVGSARAIAWLHHSCNPRLVHKGITSSCILLDEDLEPRITDFGLARLIVTGRVRPATSSSAGGAAGGVLRLDEDGYYVPPEDYSTTYSLSRATTMSSAASTATPKGDVYAFGVVLLELVTGRKPNDGGSGNDDGSTAAVDGATAGDGGGTARRRSLVDWIGELFKSGHVSEAVDKRLIAEASVLMMNPGNNDSSNGGSGRRREVMQVLKIACSCVLSYPKERPSMYEVYHMLRGVGEDYYPAAADQSVAHGHGGKKRDAIRQQHHHRQQQQRGGHGGSEVVDLEGGEGAQADKGPAGDEAGVQMQRLDG